MADKATFQKFKDITEVMKAEIRKQHPDAEVITVPVLSEESDLFSSEWSKTAKFILNPPNRATLNALQRYGAENKISQFQRVLEKNCILGGDMEYLQEGVNETVYRSVMKRCGELIKTVEVEIAKL